MSSTPRPSAPCRRGPRGRLASRAPRKPDRQIRSERLTLTEPRVHRRADDQRPTVKTAEQSRVTGASTINSGNDRRPHKPMSGLAHSCIQYLSKFYFSETIISDCKNYGTIGTIFGIMTSFIAIGAVIIPGAAVLFGKTPRS
jgi:hypothetical protein